MSIDVQQPRSYDLVGDSLRIGGVAGGAFEATFRYRVHDVAGTFQSGDGAGGHTQFQVSVDLSAAPFSTEQVAVEVFHVSPKDGTELDKVTVTVVLGRIIVPGYRDYLEHVVAPGESLWQISADYYGDGDLYHRLVAANPETITNPSVIHPGDLIRVPQA